MNQKNYSLTITNINGILKLWRIRSLSIEGKIVVFKTLAIFKLVYLALLTVINYHVSEDVAKIQIFLNGMIHLLKINMKH